jgi:hypothetical protein
MAGMLRTSRQRAPALLGIVALMIVFARPADASNSAGMLHGWETIHRFHLLSRGVGWVQTSRRVLLTTDGGQSWKDFTPPDMHPWRWELGVAFLDPEHAWIARVGKATDSRPSQTEPRRRVANRRRWANVGRSQVQAPTVALLRGLLPHRDAVRG